jgi:hypothetical protein
LFITTSETKIAVLLISIFRKQFDQRNMATRIDSLVAILLLVKLLEVGWKKWTPIC